MPKQSDVDFANELVRQGLAAKDLIGECLNILASLEEAGVTDSLDAIMLLKGYLTGEQVSATWKNVFARDPFEDEDGVFSLGEQAAAPGTGQDPVQAAPPPEKDETAPEAGPAMAEQPAPAPAAPRASKLPALPGFALESKLDKDTIGINYLGSKTGSERKSILQVLYPQMGTEQEFMAWLIKHGRKLARLDHPQAARFHALQPFENRAFYGQEIPAGEPILSFVDEQPMAEERMLLILEQIAEILAHAEEKGVFHGRLTPKNVFLHDNDTVHMRFFTLVEEERTLFLENVPADDLPFLSPEVRAGKEPTSRSDLFSMGRLALLVTGADGASPRKLSPSCMAILGKMVGIDPESRYLTPKRLLMDLELYFEGKEIPEGLDLKAPAPAAPEHKPQEPAKPEKPEAIAADAKKTPGRAEDEKPAAPLKARPVLKAKPLPPPEPAAEEEEEEEDAGEEEGDGAPRGRPGRPISRRSRTKSGGLSAGKSVRGAEGRPGARKPSGKTRILGRPPIEPPSSRIRKGPLARAGAQDEDEDEGGPEAAEPRAKPEGEKPARAAAKDAAEDPKVEGAFELASRREAKGDFSGAIDALKPAAETALNKERVAERIAELRRLGFAEVRKAAREKEKEGDYKGAIKIFEEGRLLAPNASDVDEVIKLLEERLDDEALKGEIGKLEAKSKARMEKGDVLGAVAALEEAKAISPSPLLVQAKIDATRKKAYAERMQECQEKEGAGDIDSAIGAARRARDFTDAKDEVDAVIRTLTRKKETADKSSEYRKFEEEAQKKAAEGDVDGAIECYEKSRKFASSSIAVEARIEELRNSTFDKFRSEARAAEDAGRFPDAIFAWDKARPYATDPEEIEAAIRLLRSRAQAEEQERQMQRLREEAEKFESEGQLEEAIRKLMEFESASKGPSYTTRLKVAELRKTAFETAVARSEELKASGDIDGAIQAIEGARDHAPDPKSVDLMINTLKREKSIGKRNAEFRKFQAAAKAKALKGDILGALELMEKSKAFAESPIAVDAKITGLKKATLDRLMADAKSKEVAGAWSEAVVAYKRAQPFSDDPANIDAIVATIEREIEKVRSGAELKRILNEADAFVKEGKVREAVEKLEEAKKFAPDPRELQARIDQLLIDSMYARCLELAARKEKTGDFAGAIEACVKAKEYTRDSAEIEARLARLYALMKGEAPPAEAETPKAKPAEKPAQKPDEILPGPSGPPKKKRETTVFEAVQTPEEEKADRDKGIKSDKIAVLCPNPSCKKEFRVPAKYEGRKGKCPACGTPVDVPMSGEKVVCFLCDKVLPKSKANQRGLEFYCSECNDFIGGSE